MHAHVSFLLVITFSIIKVYCNKNPMDKVLSWVSLRICCVLYLVFSSYKILLAYFTLYPLPKVTALQAWARHLCSSRPPAL